MHIPSICEMFKQLSHYLIVLKLYDCELNLMALYGFLQELPHLQSLELNVKLTMDTPIVLTQKKIPKLESLKDLKMQINDNKINEVLEITRNAPNIEFLTIFDANFKIDDFIDYLNNYKKLTSLNLTKCKVNEPKRMSELEALSTDNFTTMDATSLVYLEQLSILSLINVNDKMLDILKSKCVHELTELKVQHRCHQKETIIKYIQSLKSIKEKHLILNRLKLSWMNYNAEAERTVIGKGDNFCDKIYDELCKIINNSEKTKEFQTLEIFKYFDN